MNMPTNQSNKYNTRNFYLGTMKPLMNSYNDFFFFFFNITDKNAITEQQQISHFLN